MSLKFQRRALIVGGALVLVKPSAVLGQSAPSKKIADDMLKRFPIKVSPVADVRVTSDHSYWVGIPSFQASLNKAAPPAEIGRYDAQIHVESKEALAGFQGGSYYTFHDEKGNVVYAMMGDIYGVNGTAVPGAPSDVTKHEAKIIPLEILTATHSIKCIPTRLEGPALDNIKKTVGDFAKGIDAVKDDLKKIGAAIVEIAAAIKAAA
jgi:hypothetical protein